MDTSILDTPDFDPNPVLTAALETLEKGDENGNMDVSEQPERLNLSYYIN